MPLNFETKSSTLKLNVFRHFNSNIIRARRVIAVQNKFRFDVIKRPTLKLINNNNT